MRDPLAELVHGPTAGPGTPTISGPQDGTITRVTAEGAYVTLAKFGRLREFGPAPWPRPGGQTGDAGAPAHHHSIGGSTPPRGTACLVMFVDGSEGKPRIVSIYGWPT